MLYASTKATFKKEFGGGQLREEYYANMKEEVTLSGYKRHLKSEAAPGPLSREEEEMFGSCLASRGILRPVAFTQLSFRPNGGFPTPFAPELVFFGDFWPASQLW